jgi:DNA-binding NarL/FixJ family response regulator
VIRVLLVEDQTLVREGLETLLNLAVDIRVVAHAVDGDVALVQMREHRPDVVLLDVRMPKMSGIDVLRVMNDRKASPPVILLTTFDDDSALLEGIHLGAKGYLLRDVSLDTLTNTIRVVAEGGTMISPVVTERLTRGIHQARLPADNGYNQEALTSSREAEILWLMTGG